MYDGTIKAVEDIQVDDLVMGPDSTPRRVLELHRGQDDMVEICPIKGKSWVVNKSHILTLTRMSQGGKYPCEQGGGMYDFPIYEWFNWTQNKKNTYKLLHVAADFPCQQEPLPLHPYLLGVLLGDGGLTIAERVHLTNPDKELVQEVERLLNEQGWHLQPIPSKDRCQSYHISGRNGSGRPKDNVPTVKRIMSNLGLLPVRCENRFIPHIYKTASRQERLELLAGLLDTDGYMDKGGFEYCSKSSQLANDVAFVARSLGFAANIAEKHIPQGIYYRVHINGTGGCTEIPTRIPRKQAQPHRAQKNVLRVGFTCKYTGTVEDYYGFALDGDGRYLLDDFTVTHNSGKTVIFSHVIYSLAREHGLNAIVLCHLDELLEQAADKYRMVKPDAIIGKVGSGVHEYGGEVTVAGVQTVSRPEHLKQLKALYGTGKKLILVIDEAHLSAAPSYQRVQEALPDAFVLLVTATPYRLDGKSIIDKPPLFQRTILEMIQEKYLCDIKAIAIRTDVSLDEVKSMAGDFNERDLDLAVNTPVRNKRIVDAYQEHSLGKRALAFCVTVAHAEALCYMFNDHGIASAVVSGKTPLDERKRLYAAFERGEVLVLTTVNVLSIGFDSPRAEVAIMARPTQSQALYVQQAGRVLRLAPGKKMALLLDITDNSQRMRIMPKNFKRAIAPLAKDDESLLQALAREEDEKAEKVAAEKRALIRKLNERREKDKNVDLFGLPDWQERENGLFVMEVGLMKHRIALAPCKGTLGLYDVYARLAPNFSAGQKWMSAQPLDWAMAHAEKRARQLLDDPGAVKLVDKNASWRSKPIEPEGKQAKMLNWYRIAWGEGTSILTKGDASDAIDAHKQKIEARKAAKAERARAKAGA